MPWNQVFPLGTDQVSQAPALFQQNWAFLAGSIGQDHFFNTGAPNEGHHKFVQLLGAGDAALAAGMSAVEYSKATGNANTQQPYWRNATGIFQIPTTATGLVAVVTPGTNNIYNFTGKPRSFGSVFLCDPGNAGRAYAYCNYFWDPGLPQLAILSIVTTNPGINTIGFIGNTLTCQTDFNGNVTFAINVQPF